MASVMVIQGRRLDESDMGTIRGLLDAHPDWHRTHRYGRPVACALFGSAAWKCADRDAFLGWDRPTRERNLQHLTNNTRFLFILAAVRAHFRGEPAPSLLPALG